MTFNNIIYRIKQKKYVVLVTCFRYKTYLNLGFKILLKNKKASYYKLIVLKRLIKGVKKSKEELASKIFMFNHYIQKSFQIKDSLIHLKFKAQNSPIKLSNDKKEELILYQKKNHYRRFFDILKENKAIKDISVHYNVCFVKKIYISFFKKVCITLGNKAKETKQLNDAEEIYLFNLARKAIRRLYKNKIENKILKEENQQSLYYRQLHLKKYYFKRLHRTAHLVATNRLARLKFISKYILKWTEAVMINKKNRIQGVKLLIKEFELIYNEKLIKNITFFYFRLQQIYKVKLNQEILKIKLLKFTKYRNTKVKHKSIIHLRYNAIFNYLEKKHNYFLKKKSILGLKVHKKHKDVIKSKQGEQLNLVRLYTKIKMWFKYMRVQSIRKKYLKRRILHYLFISVYRININDNERADKFRRLYLCYNCFNMLKVNYLISYRENKILEKAHEMIIKRRRRLLFLSMLGLYKNKEINLFVRRRELRIITKVFYALKMLTTY